MANYQNLLDSIANVITTNNNNEITGAIMKSTLQSIVSVLGANATFGGVAHPTDNPGTPDGSVVYIASEAGTYTNFGGLTLSANELAVLMWNSSAWSKNTITTLADKDDVDDMAEEMFGATTQGSIASVQTRTGMYMSKQYSGAFVTTSQPWSIYSYPITAGKKYIINVPKAPNSAAYVICYRTTLESGAAAYVVPLTDTTGTNTAFSYTINSALNYPYIAVGFYTSYGEPSVVTDINAAPIVVKTEEQTFTESAKTQARTNIGAASVSVEEDITEINGQLYYDDVKVVNWVDDVLCYTNTQVNGAWRTLSGFRCTLPILMYAGETVTITTAASDSYITVPIVQCTDGVSAQVKNGVTAGPILVLRSSTSEQTYTYTATEDIYISICGTTDCTYSFSNLKKMSEIDKINVNSPMLKDKRVMFFGASNTANSTTGVIGFAKLIADAAGLPYRGLLYDSDDGNPNDVIATYPNVTNYAKDGTCLRNVSGRNDCVIQRIERHVTSNDYPDYVILGFPANDAASTYQNIGEIDDSYTATFDTDTQLGALEEVCRYVTTLGLPIRFGCIIPWYITWVSDTWYDAYIPVMEKWGIPYLDLRKCAGFDISHCAAHRNLYSLSSESYSAYDSTTTYNLDDRVIYGGSLYKCTDDGVVGIPPTNTDYWMFVSSDSADGTHLNNIGNQIVAGKIRSFIESL